MASIKYYMQLLVKSYNAINKGDVTEAHTSYMEIMGRLQEVSDSGFGDHAMILVSGVGMDIAEGLAKEKRLIELMRFTDSAIALADFKHIDFYSNNMAMGVFCLRVHRALAQTLAEVEEIPHPILLDEHIARAMSMYKSYAQIAAMPVFHMDTTHHDFLDSLIANIRLATRCNYRPLQIEFLKYQREPLYCLRKKKEGVSLEDIAPDVKLKIMQLQVEFAKLINVLHSESNPLVDNRMLALETASFLMKNLDAQYHEPALLTLSNILVAILPTYYTHLTKNLSHKDAREQTIQLSKLTIMISIALSRTCNSRTRDFYRIINNLSDAVASSIDSAIRTETEFSDGNNHAVLLTFMDSLKRPLQANLKPGIQTLERVSLKTTKTLSTLCDHYHLHKQDTKAMLFFDILMQQESDITSKKGKKQFYQSASQIFEALGQQLKHRNDYKALAAKFSNNA